MLIEAGLSRVWVRGEVSGFKVYQSGHWYFTLRDAQAQIRCVMWRSDNQRAQQPEEGLQVFVEAAPTVWEERGEFRLTVRQLLPTDASGVWQLRLDRARAALERDGLLDPARKRRLTRTAKAVPARWNRTDCRRSRRVDLVRLFPVEYRIPPGHESFAAHEKTYRSDRYHHHRNTTSGKLCRRHQAVHPGQP